MAFGQFIYLEFFTLPCLWSPSFRRFCVFVGEPDSLLVANFVFNALCFVKLIFALSLLEKNFRQKLPCTRKKLFNHAFRTRIDFYLASCFSEYLEHLVLNTFGNFLTILFKTDSEPMSILYPNWVSTMTPPHTSWDYFMLSVESSRWMNVQAGIVLSCAFTINSSIPKQSSNGCSATCYISPEGPWPSIVAFALRVTKFSNCFNFTLFDAPDWSTAATMDQNIQPLQKIPRKFVMNPIG